MLESIQDIEFSSTNEVETGGFRYNFTLDEYHCTSSVNIISIKQGDDLVKTAESIVNNLNEFGYCVLDNFLGAENSQKVLGDVIQISNSGVMKEGKLVSSKVQSPKSNVRGDEITWVTGDEEMNENLKFFMTSADKLISCCASFLVNRVEGRTPVSILKIQFCCKKLNSMFNEYIYTVFLCI